MLEENLKIIKNAKLDIELLRRENEKLCRANEFKIEELNVTVGVTEELLEFELKESGKKKLECKLGWCAFRVMPDKWEYDDIKIIKFIKTLPDICADDFLKITTALRKDSLKKNILAHNDDLFTDGKLDIDGKEINEENGELFLVDGKDDYKVPGLAVRTQDPKFNYKLNGGL